MAHIGIFRKKGIKERESTREKIPLDEGGEMLQRGTDLPTSACGSPTGGQQLGAGAPSISGFILCCPPPLPRGVYPSSCYKGSILTNIRKNQGEVQGEPGSGRDIKDLEAFGPSNGGGGGDALEEISAPFSSSYTPLLCRRSQPRFLLITSSASCVSI